jgi:CRISPR-associated protein (TIGR02584 family)
MEEKLPKNKEILLISVGATPQVVTETLWYYTYNEVREFDKIVLVTTSMGKNNIHKELYKNKRLESLETALSKPEGHFKIPDENIITLKDSEGNELDDIRTSNDSEDMASHVFEILKDLTQDQNSRLTIVIAGGRKTMPAILALASSFYGREQDEMVHVLINDELFWSDWFFPDDPNDPKQKIEISQLPFLRLKNYTTGINADSPLDALSIAQTRLNELAPLTNVTIDKNMITVGDQTFKLPPAEMQLWRYMARKKIEQCVREDLEFCGMCSECFSTHAELIDEFDGKIANEYFQIVKNGSQAWDNRKEGLGKRDYLDTEMRVRELKSKLKKNIRLRIADLRIYHSLQVTEAPFQENGSEIANGISIDKNVIMIKNNNVAR